MTIRTLALATAAASLAIAPVAAQAASAPVDRMSAPATEESELRGRLGPALIIIALAALGMAFLLLTDDDDLEVTSP